MRLPQFVWMALCKLNILHHPEAAHSQYVVVSTHYVSNGVLARHRVERFVDVDISCHPVTSLDDIGEGLEFQKLQKEIREGLQRGQILIMYQTTWRLVNQDTMRFRPIDGDQQQVVALAFRLYTPNWRHKASWDAQGMSTVNKELRAGILSFTNWMACLKKAVPDSIFQQAFPDPD